MWAASRLCRQIPADAAASQLCKTSTSVLPLLPGDGAQPPPDPFVECAQHRWSLAEAEVAAPAAQVDGQLLDDLREASSARAPRQLPDLRLEAGNGLRCDASAWPSPTCKAEAQELADARFGNRALGLVDLQLETLGEEAFDACHHSLACLLTAHIDVAVVSVAHE